MNITYDRRKFFDAIRPLFGSISPSQVAGLTYLLSAWEGQYPSGSLKFLAYCLATAFHETGRTMLPIKERGNGDGPDADKWDDYLEKYDTGRLAKVLGNTPEADGDGVRYAGKGYVQITGLTNYARATRRLKELFGIEADLVSNPDLALDPKIAALCLYVGATEGWFTGKKLADYFGGDKAAPVAARRIINGTDEAVKIAGYYDSFVKALLASEVKRYPNPLPLPEPETPKPEVPGTILTPKIEEKTDTAPTWVSIVKSLLNLFNKNTKE